jgi:TonB family protein
MTTIMIADPPQNSSLGVGFDAGRGRSGDPQAWKQKIGTRPIPARLALLPDGKPAWKTVGASATLQIAIVTFFLIIPLLFPEKMMTALNYVRIEIPQPPTIIPVAPPPPPPPKVKAAVVPKVEAVKPPPVVEPPKLNPQQQHIFADLTKPKVQKIEKIDAKAPDLAAPVITEVKIETKDNAPKRPKEDVKLNTMNTGSAAPATVNAPVNKVQTGGFGDPNGLPGKGDPNHATNVNRLGSPNLPGGEGYGNGTAGKDGIRGTVASTGFGNGTATPPAGGSGRKGTVASSGFGDASANTAAPKKKAVDGGPADTPIVIVEKPKPEYTAEGRSLKIEGDVVLDLVFLANGTVQMNRVVSGLGHGLDEAAVRAAQQIKFKVAKREGTPVDFPARVRIEFRLAY